MVGNGSLIHSETVAHFIFLQGSHLCFSYLSQDQEHLVAFEFVHTPPWLLIAGTVAL